MRWGPEVLLLFPGMMTTHPWRVITAFLFPGILKIEIAVTLLGLHVGTWYVLSSHNNKHEAVFAQASTMWIFCLLFAYFVDSEVMIAPLNSFMVSMILGAWSVGN